MDDEARRLGVGDRHAAWMGLGLREARRRIDGNPAAILSGRVRLAGDRRQQAERTGAGSQRGVEERAAPVHDGRQPGDSNLSQARWAAREWRWRHDATAGYRSARWRPAGCPNPDFVTCSRATWTPCTGSRSPPAILARTLLTSTATLNWSAASTLYPTPCWPRSSR